jgi:hypothetical protein
LAMENDSKKNSGTGRQLRTCNWSHVYHAIFTHFAGCFPNMSEICMHYNLKTIKKSFQRTI